MLQESVSVRGKADHHLINRRSNLQGACLAPPRRHKIPAPRQSPTTAAPSCGGRSAQMLEQGHSQRKPARRPATARRRARAAPAEAALLQLPRSIPARRSSSRCPSSSASWAGRSAEQHEGCGVMPCDGPSFFFLFSFFFSKFFLFFKFFSFFFSTIFFFSLSLSLFSPLTCHLSWHTGVLSQRFAPRSNCVHKLHLIREACCPGTYDTQYDIFGSPAACLTRCDTL